MKTLFITLTVVLLGFAAHSQDLLGTQSSDIRNTTKGAKGLSIQSSGDSTLEVINKYSRRYFKFKLDPATGICFQEEVQLDASDYVNLRIIEKFINSKKFSKISEDNNTSVYENNLKTVHVIHEGDLVHIIFSLKVSPSAFMAIRNPEENN